MATHTHTHTHTHTEHSLLRASLKNQTLDVNLKSDGRRAQIWVKGAFNFLSLQIYFDQSCCWGRGSVAVLYMEWISTRNHLTGGTTINVIWLTINLEFRKGLITKNDSTVCPTLYPSLANSKVQTQTRPALVNQTFPIAGGKTS